MTPLHQQRAPLELTPDALSALGRVQADILQDHGRRHAVLLFVHLGDDRASARRWLADIAPLLTSAADQLEQRASGGDAGTLHTVALSGRGYALLGLDDPSTFLETGLDSQPCSPLREGMAARRRVLAQDPPPSAWSPDLQQATPASVIHALVTVADDDWVRAQAAATSIARSLPAGGRLVARRDGHRLRRGHHAIEHFGFRDGISQPRFLAHEVREESATLGTSIWNPSSGPGNVLAPDPFGGDGDAGSMIVFRQLEQDVPAFLRQEEALCRALGATTPEARERVEAMIIGRTRAGVPLLAANARSENDFDFTGDNAPPFLCPAHSHIRKANPRSDRAIRDNFRDRRIARRGMPYGVDPDTLTALPGDDVERGLLFVCCQRSISTQFEYIQAHWFDDGEFPMPLTGQDPLLGSASGGAQKWPAAPDGGTIRFGFGDAVHMRGGEYFFAASLPFFRALG